MAKTCLGGTSCHHDPMCPPTWKTLSESVGVGEKKADDMVVNPKHYSLSEHWEGRLDAMDVIRMVLGEEGWKAYCKGNMLKYLLRKKWDADQDVAKSGRYADMYKGEIQAKK